jgi:hypothetical protein
MAQLHHVADAGKASGIVQQNLDNVLGEMWMVMYWWKQKEAVESSLQIKSTISLKHKHKQKQKQK